MTAETQPVRDEERVDTEALARWLGAPVEIEQFPGGHSNLTYLVRSGGEEYVLRRPPLGPVAPRAHDMIREARLLEAVAPLFPPAPRPVRICEDASILGAPFYLMERRRGVVIRTTPPAGIDPLAISTALVETLAQLHRVALPAGIGKPDGFLDRQVTGWADRWRRARTRDLDAIDRVIAWLTARLPAPQAACILHNDYKLDNVMLDARGEVVAVLDWEMAAAGDPLIDLGILLCYWRERPTCEAGWMPRDELIARYAGGTGFDVSRIDYYEVFALFKVAVVLEQIYARWKAGQTSDPRFASLRARVEGLATEAARFL